MKKKLWYSESRHADRPVNSEHAARARAGSKRSASPCVAAADMRPSSSRAVKLLPSPNCLVICLFGDFLC